MEKWGKNCLAARLASKSRPMRIWVRSPGFSLPDARRAGRRGAFRDVGKSRIPGFVVQASACRTIVPRSGRKLSEASGRRGFIARPCFASVRSGQNHGQGCVGCPNAKRTEERPAETVGIRNGVLAAHSVARSVRSILSIDGMNQCQWLPFCPSSVLIMPEGQDQSCAFLVGNENLKRSIVQCPGLVRIIRDIPGKS